MGRRIFAKWQLCLLIHSALVPSVARADIGEVRASERHGDLQITVFTAPTPLRAGFIDVGVLVLDVTTGKPVLDADLKIEVAPADGSRKPVLYAATHAAATNKLFYASQLNLLFPGVWRFRVILERPHERVDVPFEAEADAPFPTWRSHWLWFTWPLLVVGWFVAAKMKA